jgi:hypothetical protein
VVTVTSTVPTVPAGAVAVMLVALLTVNAAGFAPKSTAVAPVKVVPVTVTLVVPVLCPEVGLTPVTVGAGAGVYVNWSAVLVALVPPGVVTVTSTGPVPLPVGAVAVMLVALLTVKAAVVVPKSTLLAPVKLVPVTVTDVPAVTEPEFGLMLVTVGCSAGGPVVMTTF